MTMETEAEVIAGQRESMRRRGYDWPIRIVGPFGGSKAVVLPEQVKEYFELSRGDWLVFGGTKWSCLVWMMKVDQKQKELLIEGRGKDKWMYVSKVQWKKKAAKVVIPSRICKDMKVEVGDLAVFVSSVQVGVYGMGILRGGRNSTGSRRAG